MRNQKIRDELGLIYIERRLKIKPLKWFGHMVWMVNNVSTTSGRIRNTYSKKKWDKSDRTEENCRQEKRLNEMDRDSPDTMRNAWRKK